MRISVWQQFGSNHSSAYFVVGEFASPAAALSAQQNVRKVMGALSTRKKANLDKILGAGSAEELLEEDHFGEVSTYDSFVWFCVPHTWGSSAPMAEYFKKLGSRTTVTGNAFDHPLVVDFTCRISNQIEPNWVIQQLQSDEFRERLDTSTRESFEHHFVAYGIGWELLEPGTLRFSLRLPEGEFEFSQFMETTHRELLSRGIESFETSFRNWAETDRQMLQPANSSLLPSVSENACIQFCDHGKIFEVLVWFEGLAFPWKPRARITIHDSDLVYEIRFSRAKPSDIPGVLVSWLERYESRQVLQNGGTNVPAFTVSIEALTDSLQPLAQLGLEAPQPTTENIEKGLYRAELLSSLKDWFTAQRFAYRETIESHGSTLEITVDLTVAKRAAVAVSHLAPSGEITEKTFKISAAKEDQLQLYKFCSAIKDIYSLLGQRQLFRALEMDAGEVASLWFPEAAADTRRNMLKNALDKRS